MIITRHPTKDLSILFDPLNHTYIDSNNVKYTSVTTKISNNFPKFDTDGIASKCAIKRGVTKESLIKEWALKSKIAGELGTSIHNYIDSRLRNSKDLPIIDEFYKSSIEELLFQLFKTHQIIFSEKIIFSPLLQVAGTVDAVFYKCETNEYVLMDWKTSKFINTVNYYGEKGLGPLNHLDHCNYVHYSLQLLMYGYLLKKEGYLKPNTSLTYKIVNIHPSGGFKKTIEYDILNLNQEANIILQQ